jgi:hypothetical protein
MGGIFSSMVQQDNSTTQVNANTPQTLTDQPTLQSSTPTPQNVESKPQTVESKLQASTPTPQTVESKPQIVESKSQASTPTPQTVESKPQASTPTPQTVGSKSQASTPTSLSDSTAKTVEAVQTKIKETVEAVKQTTTESVKALEAKIKEQTEPIQQKVTETIKQQTGIDLAVEQEDPLYGKGVTLLEFICSIWARLAYMNSTNFVSHYKNIFEDSVVIDEGGITVKMAMEGIAKDPSYLTKFVKFMPFAEHVNKINGEASKVKKGWANAVKSRSKNELNCEDTIPLPSPEQQNLILTTIGTSNYSQCCVFADIRNPTMICVSFRGTYSPKSAGSYTQFTSLTPTPINTGSKIKVLSGVYKIMIEMMHSILCAVDDLKEQLKQHTKDDKFKLIVTGHSLGGALATLFTYVYMKTTTITKESQITCVSLGAPRVFNEDGAKEFCKMCTEENLFLFKRVTTLNDIVPALPKLFGYQHPCSASDQLENRTKVSVDCLAQVDNSFSMRCSTINKRISMTPNYTLKLSCTNKKDRKKNKFGLTDSPLLKVHIGYHIIYLGILYAGAISLSSFMTLPVSKSSVEINRFPFEQNDMSATTLKKMAGNLGDTACRLCFYDGNVYKTVFFNLVHFRKQIGRYYEDVYITPENFKKIKEKASFIKPETIIPTENFIPSKNPSVPTTPESDVFPTPDKFQSFLLPMEKSTEPPIADPTEPSPEDIEKSKKNFNEIGDETSKSGDENSTSDAPTESEKASTETPASDVPAEPEKTSTDAPASDVPAEPEKASTETPASDAPVEPEKASTEAPASDAPTEPEKTSTETPASDAPTEPEKPSTEAPASDAPTELEKPSTETPASDAPTEPEKPSTEVPVSDAPVESKKTSTEAPASDAPSDSSESKEIIDKKSETIDVKLPSSNSAAAAGGGRKSLKKSMKKNSVKRRKYKIKKSVRKYKK